MVQKQSNKKKTENSCMLDIDGGWTLKIQEENKKGNQRNGDKNETQNTKTWGYLREI